MNADAIQSRFARAVEARYARQATRYQDAGLGPKQAHLRAFEDAKKLGREALEELRRRGLFPWRGAELEPEGGPDVD